ncbi:MAG: hypothetical protein QOD42_1110 [Sphingomonadales bacterium]|jgi:hypothetical protein|nr:hypothetical protein [Sphingomonadales bacterium]
MARPEVDLSPEEATRAAMRWAIPKLPDAVSSRMLSDSAVLSRLGLPTGDFIRLWNVRFSRPALFACLRDIANGRKAALSSSDGELHVDEGHLDEEGAALLRIGTDTLRFANVAVLGEDVDRRQRGIDSIVASGEMPAEREGMWRAAAAMGPLDDALFLALETELGASPEAAFRDIEQGISDGSATFNDLIPSDFNHCAGLINLYPPPPSPDEFRSAWLGRAAELDSVRLTRLLKLSGPLSVLSGGLVAQASDNLSPGLRMELVTFLQSCPDPFSVVAAFEIACRHRTDPSLRAAADLLVPRLFDRSDPLVELGGTALAASTMIATAFTARSRTLGGWPLYAKRLAGLFHAGHLLRVFRAASIDPAPFNEEVARTFAPQARLADLCDAREAPVFQAQHLGPPFVHALIASRVTEAIAQIPEPDRPPEWIAAGEGAVAAAVDKGWGLFLFAPGPFDEFERGWKGQDVLPAESAEEMRLTFVSGSDLEGGMSELIKLSVAFEVPVDQRSGIAVSLPPFIRRLDGPNFLLAAEIGLQLGARWRDEGLSDRIVDLLLDCVRGDGLVDGGAAPRLIMLAAAAVENRGLWLERAGNLAQQFAYVQQPGAPSINLMRAIDLLRDFEPDLGPRLRSAKAFALLTFDRLPQPRPQPDRTAEQNERSGPEDT